MNVKIGIVSHLLIKPFQSAKIVCEQRLLNCTFVDYDGPLIFGTAFENGTSTGMTAVVHRGELDTFVPSFTPTHARFHAIDFSDPYFYNDIILVTRAPKLVSKEFNFGIVSALRWETWCVLICAFLVTSLFLDYSTRNFLQPHSGRTQATNRLISIYDHCMSLINQKYDDRYVAMDFVRILVICLSFVSMVLSSCYTAVLFSDMLKGEKIVPYEDFESFITCLEQSRCRVAFLSESSSHVQVLFGPESALGRRARATFAYNPPLSIEPWAATEAILQENNTYLVWIGEKNIVDAYSARHDGCAFYLVETGYRESWTFPVQKRSPLKRIFDEAAAAFQERGLTQHLSTKYDAAAAKCDAAYFNSLSRSTGSSTVTYAAMCLLAIGFGISSIALFIELVIDRRSKNRMKQTVAYLIEKQIAMMNEGL